MIIGGRLPHVETILLSWPNYRSFSISENFHRKKIRIVWVRCSPEIKFRIFFNRAPEIYGETEVRKVSLSFIVTENTFPQFTLPFVIFEDSGKDCYKGSINFVMVEEYYTGSARFHLIEY